MNEQIAWAAGLFEGEGCFTLKKQPVGYRTRLVMSLSMTDSDVIQRFAVIAGCGAVRKIGFRDGKKPQYGWECSGVAANAFASRLLPHLGQRRTRRLGEIRAAVEESQPKPRDCECCDETFAPTRFDRERFCSEPCRDRAKYLNRRYGTTSLRTALARGYCPTTPPRGLQLPPRRLTAVRPGSYPSG